MLTDDGLVWRTIPAPVHHDERHGSRRLSIAPKNFRQKDIAFTETIFVSSNTETIFFLFLCFFLSFFLTVRLSCPKSKKVTSEGDKYAAVRRD